MSLSILLFRQLLSVIIVYFCDLVSLEMHRRLIF